MLQLILNRGANILITIRQKNPDGSGDFDLTMNEGELNYLINFAVESLLQIGSIAYRDNVEGPQEVELPTITRDPTDDSTPTIN